MSNVGAPGLAVVGSTDLLLVYRDGANHVTTGTNRGRIYGITSSDGGITWSSAATIIDDTTNQYDARDPILLTHSDTTVIMSYFLYDGTTSTGPRAALSTDDGVSWSTVSVTNSFTGWAAPSGMMIELANGDVLMPLYGIDTGDTDTSVRISRSTDSGATWSALAEVVDGQAAGRSYQEPSLVLLAGGVIGCMIRTDDNQFYWSTSSDSGATWTAPTSVGWGDQPSGRPGILRTPDGALICTYRALGSNWMSRYRMSIDNGASWSSYVNLLQLTPVAGDADYYWYSQMATLDGVVHCAHAFQASDTSSTTYVTAFLKDELATTLVVQDASREIVPDSVALTQTHALTVQDSSRAIVPDAVTLTVVYDLVVQDASRAIVADNVTLDVSSTLVVQDASRAIVPDAVTLTQVHQLAVQDAARAIVPDSVALTQVHALSVQDSSRAIVPDSVTLTQTHVLVVQDASREIVADSITLDSAATLTVQDASRAIVADTVTLEVIYDLAVQDTARAIVPDTLTLTQAHNLTVADTSRDIVSDSVTLAVIYDLAVQDAVRLIVADNVDIELIVNGPSVPGPVISWREPRSVTWTEPGAESWREPRAVAYTEPGAVSWREPVKGNA